MIKRRDLLSSFWGPKSEGRQGTRACPPPPLHPRILNLIHRPLPRRHPDASDRCIARTICLQAQNPATKSLYI